MSPGRRPSDKQAGDLDPASQPPHRIKALLLATDLSARSERALERALQLAGRHAARLTVLHIVDDNLPIGDQDRAAAAAKEEIDACIEKMGRPDNVNLSIKIAPGKDDQDIMQEAADSEVDLIVLGIHRNESGTRPITGTTMERVIRNGSRPVLVVSDRTTGPYANVMIGIDFSVYSRFAIRAAFAAAPDAEFSCVHSFRVPFEGFQPSRETRRTVQSAHERELAQIIESEMDALIGSAPNIQQSGERIQTIVRHGDVRPTLRAEAERLRPDLLVLGTHGRAGIAHMVLGSVAEDFLNHPPCDVLVVKAW